ncbi:MAG: aldehyde dehydrogenase family protein, partial [Burkholderiaceae bacterium]
MIKEFLRHYIAGNWQPSSGADTIEITDPASGEAVARVTCGEPRDALAAAAAAKGAFANWSALSLERRTEFVRQFGAALASRKDALAQTIASEVGTPLKISQIVQVDSPIRNVDNFIQAAFELDWERQIGNSRVVREPSGVVACITPWNFPLHQIVLKVVPALLGGNTIVLKPSEMVPATNELICEALHETGFPAGVINVVNGTGPVVGACLATTELVDMVSFTGSTEAGKTVTAMAAATVKKVTTELGGKSPSLALPGADLARAVKATLGSCMLNNGQTCSALTRLLVPAEQRAEVESLLRQEMAKLAVGPALAEGTRVGPLVSRRQSERAQQLIADGVAQGAV